MIKLVKNFKDKLILNFTKTWRTTTELILLLIQ